MKTNVIAETLMVICDRAKEERGEFDINKPTYGIMEAMSMFKDEQITKGLINYILQVNGREDSDLSLERILDAMLSYGKKIMLPDLDKDEVMELSYIKDVWRGLDDKKTTEIITEYWEDI